MLLAILGRRGRVVAAAGSRLRRLRVAVVAVRRRGRPMLKLEEGDLRTATAVVGLVVVRLVGMVVVVVEAGGGGGGGGSGRCGGRHQVERRWVPEIKLYVYTN